MWFVPLLLIIYNIFSSITPINWFDILILIFDIYAAASFWQIILPSMLAQHRLNRHFDKKKQLKNLSVVVPFEWEEQQDNKLISPQEVKLCCGICDANTLCGPESKSYKKLNINFLSGCIQAYGWWILSKFSGKFQDMFNGSP